MDQKVFNTLEMPLKKLMELNMKTIQHISYLKPNDLLNVKKPGDIVERNLNMFVHNNQLALNYLRESFHILEGHWSHVSDRAEDIVKSEVRKAAPAVKKAVKKSVASAKSTVKKATSTKSSVKSGVKKIAKAVNPAVSSKPKAAASKSKVVVSKPKVASSKPQVAVNKPKATSVTPSIKHQVPAFNNNARSGIQTKDATQNMPKVGGVPEKSGIKDLGLLVNKSNRPN